MLPITAAVALTSAVSVTEELHLRHLREHAQTALDHAVADVALKKMDASALEEALRARAPGKLDQVVIAMPSEHQTVAVAELTLPSAWPTLKRDGYREVVTSQVSIQPSSADPRPTSAPSKDPSVLQAAPCYRLCGPGFSIVTRSADDPEPVHGQRTRR